MNHVKFYRKMQPFTKYIQRGKKSANKKYEKVSNQPPSMPPATGEAPWISPLKGSPTESSMPMGDASIEGGMQPEVDEVSKGLENMFNVSIADINPMRSMIGDINEMIGETYTIRDLKDHYHLKIPLHEFHRLKEGDDITISVDTIKELKIRINQDVPGLETFPIDDQFKTLSRLQIIKLPKDIQEKKISATLKVSKGENAVILEVPKASKKTEKETHIPISYV